MLTVCTMFLLSTLAVIELAARAPLLIESEEEIRAGVERPADRE